MKMMLLSNSRVVRYLQYTHAVVKITLPVEIPQNINTSESLFASVDLLGNFTDGVMFVTP